MKNLSVDNGLTSGNSPEHICSCIKYVGYDTIIYAMDDDIREIVHNKNVIYSQLSFILAYLRLSKYDLIICTIFSLLPFLLTVKASAK